ncbi:Gfo/Idh/MocA family protein [Thaumasiovibrio subtropicus]|uniref:Gfo/Idh/MocA family protein n=1 Tax=Thaumasiovibrio subtropicus TaxID=1891207 RepID=UPI000B360F48|nr:Gfo/Idh/MocA family oxidoreductase [Thaumasiovibrio subtropicus]
MRIAMIGLGDIAQKAYLQPLSQSKDIELVLCTRNADTLNQLASQYRIPHTVTDYQDLFRLNLDGVMVHAATSVHPQIARYFLEAGIPVFVDKPLADSAAQCEALYELAEKKQTPLYVGFNRRHLPLLNQHAQDLCDEPSKVSHLRWEKHRANLPGDLRTFIFDDFIHPLDSINLFAKADLDDVALHCQWHGEQLRRIDIQWQHNNTLLSASMDRMHGATKEHITVETENRTLRLDNFLSGTVYEQGAATQVQTPDWMPMLETKGFHGMLDEWKAVIQTGSVDSRQIARNLASHQLAEAICRKLAR